MCDGEKGREEVCVTVKREERERRCVTVKREEREEVCDVKRERPYGLFRQI